MDVEKLIAFIKTLGFPVAVAIWFLYKIQNFMDMQTAHQATLIELMRQLIALHAK